MATWRRPQQDWPACRLPAGYWQEKGGRAAAAAAKAAAKAKELLEEEAAKAAATNRWKQWAKHSDGKQSTSNHNSKQCNARLVSLD